MKDEDDDAYDSVVAAAMMRIRCDAWMTNRHRSDELTSLASRWRSQGILPGAERRRAREVAHALKGSAGTFGHPEVGTAAARLEELLGDDIAPDCDAAASDVWSLIERINEQLSCPPSEEFPE